MAVCQLSTSISLNEIKSSVQSYMGSISYLKKVIPISISNILYHRIDYDDNLFDTRKIKDFVYKTYSKKVNSKHDLSNVYHWTQNAMDSLEKKLLKELFIIIKDKDTDQVLENYNFLFTYNAEVADNESSKKGTAVLEATKNFFKSIELLNEYDKLPNSVTFAMQVVLNDDAPTSYETPGFDRGEPIVKPTSNAKFIKVGKIKTGYHKIDLIARGNPYNNDSPRSTQYSKSVADVGVADLVDSALVDAIDDVDEELAEIEYFKETKEIDIVEHGVNLPTEVKDESSLNMSAYSVSDIMSPGNDDLTFNCMCQLRESIDKIDNINCISCGFMNHVPCVGYKNAKDLSVEFNCYKCCIKLNKKYIDTRMVTFKQKPIRQRFLALTRLFCIYSTDSTDPPEIFFNKLEDRDFLIDKFKVINLIFIGKDSTFKYNHQHIKHAIQTYFYKSTDSMKLVETVDILEVESDTQDSQRLSASKKQRTN